MTIIRTTGIATLLMLAALPAQAIDCNNAQTTRDMVVCAQSDYDMADADLNRYYQEQRASLDEKGKIILRDAQRAWIKYRDAECARVADFARGGTLASVLQVSCLADLTAKRANDLAINPNTGQRN